MNIRLYNAKILSMNADEDIFDGEIWIKGDNLFQGYYGQPEETANVMTPD